MTSQPTDASNQPLPALEQDGADGYFDLCGLEELQRIGALSFTFRHAERGVHDVGVFWDGEEVFAIDDWCPHADAFLHAGDIFRRRIVCPLHNATFDLKTGECVDRFTYDVRAYESEVRDGRVWVHLPGDERWKRGGRFWSREEGKSS